MSNKEQKKQKKPVIQKTKKANGNEEYYITTAPQKTVFGKIIIWALIILMGLGGLGGLIATFIMLANQ